MNAHLASSLDGLYFFTSFNVRGDRLTAEQVLAL